MSALVEAKRAFYRDDRVAAAYDRQRFGGSSGAYVNTREIGLAGSLLPPRMDAVADVGTGTGRLLPLLRERASRVLGLDASLAMLGAAKGVLIQADAFALPIRDGGLDAATCLRLLFHFDDPAPALRELRRVVGAGGVLVCDTSTWSPRGLLPLGRRAWGERVAAMSRPRFRALAQAAGWRVAAERPCFLISPYMYRRLPLALARALERLERHLPEQLLCRVFWRLEAA
jgi:ubiquinone/menaquinone biosynthesis C-methylase UbiE